MPDRVECPRCRKTEMVRQENVMRGSDPYINYKCGACRYSWQVKDVPRRQAGTGKKSPADSEQPRKDER